MLAPLPRPQISSSTLHQQLPNPDAYATAPMYVIISELHTETYMQFQLTKFLIHKIVNLISSNAAYICIINDLYTDLYAVVILSLTAPVMSMVLWIHY